MRTHSLLLLSLSFSTIAGQAFAEAHYPQNVAPRLFGSNQWSTGSCWAHAKVHAVEQAYANEGLPLRFSANHWHAFHYRDVTDPAKAASYKLYPVSPKEKAHLEKTGPLVPDYMSPEDEAGLLPLQTFSKGTGYPGLKPPAHTRETIDGEFLPLSEFGYVEDENVFNYGGAGGDIETIKKHIRENVPTLLGVHGAFFDDQVGHFDQKTGLMGKAFRKDSFLETLKAIDQKDGGKNKGNEWKGLFNHAVAVIGFDDDLYADQYDAANRGAFIVRNSWNSPYSVKRAFEPLSEAEKVEFAKFRGKFLPTNFTGYYALPYAYVRAAIESKGYSYWTVQFDRSRFADQYARFAPRYKVKSLPFACTSPGSDLNSKAAQPHLAKINLRLLGYKEAVEDNAPADKIGAAISEMGNRFNASFGLAKVSVYSAPNGSVSDPTASFYAASRPEWTEFYCAGIGAGPHGIWPNGRELEAARAGVDAVAAQPGSPNSWFKFFDGLMPAYPNLPKNP